MHFNGIYVHYSLVVYIVDKLNSEYDFIIAYEGLTYEKALERIKVDEGN